MIELQREGDWFLMELAKGSQEEIGSIQRCRLYMKAATLADVFSADGCALKESTMVGTPLARNLD